MASYRFRAECLLDAVTFINMTHPDRAVVDAVEVDGQKLPDVDVEVETPLTLDEIREVMKAIADNHVMIETVNIKENYTGERYFVDGGKY